MLVTMHRKDLSLGFAKISTNTRSLNVEPLVVRRMDVRPLDVRTLAVISLDVRVQWMKDQFM